VAGITDATALRASERRQRSSYSTNSESVNKTAAARFALAAACAGFFLYMPIWSLLADGPFSWHVARPAAWQGGLEVVVLWMVIALATATRPAVLGCWIAGIGVTFYARRHG